MRNIKSGLPRRRRFGNAMRDYDALPSDLRHWLSSASLPWSPASALRIWSKAGGSSDPSQAIERLNAVEKTMLDKDRGIWRCG
ncbi:DUF6525 family protein [Phaeobacter marinintestinus]|uniref:DUF6525 family protein n=1 Tax=Falsiphaeobacter marinintestinus TaxID=1492905 RepID=UPI001C98D2CA|nr:DUF6525 family protein [Phaeobacter marinintestinus]